MDHVTGTGLAAVLDFPLGMLRSLAWLSQAPFSIGTGLAATLLGVEGGYLMQTLLQMPPGAKPSVSVVLQWPLQSLMTFPRWQTSARQMGCQPRGEGDPGFHSLPSHSCPVLLILSLPHCPRFQSSCFAQFLAVGAG